MASDRAREAAAALERATYLGDDHHAVQAFARFEAETLERAAKVAEAIMDTDGVRQYKSRGVTGLWVAEKAATSIRNMKDAEHG